MCIHKLTFSTYIFRAVAKQNSYQYKLSILLIFMPKVNNIHICLSQNKNRAKIRVKKNLYF